MNTPIYLFYNFYLYKHQSVYYTHIHSPIELDEQRERDERLTICKVISCESSNLLKNFRLCIFRSIHHLNHGLNGIYMLRIEHTYTFSLLNSYCYPIVHISLYRSMCIVHWERTDLQCVLHDEKVYSQVVRPSVWCRSYFFLVTFCSWGHANNAHLPMPSLLIFAFCVYVCMCKCVSFCC